MSGKQNPLTVSAQVTLNSEGDGTAEIGPTGFGEVWSDLVVSVNCATNTSEASCRVYVGAAASPNYFCDGTYSGSTGDSTTNIPGTVLSGQQIYATWAGGDAGTTGYLNVTGTRQVA